MEIVSNELETLPCNGDPFLLLMNGHNGNMAMVGQLFGMAGFEKTAQEAVLPGYDDDEVDILISSKLADSLLEIILADEIELRIIPLEQVFHDRTF